MQRCCWLSIHQTTFVSMPWNQSNQVLISIDFRRDRGRYIASDFECYWGAIEGLRGLPVQDMRLEDSDALFNIWRDVDIRLISTIFIMGAEWGCLIWYQPPSHPVSPAWIISRLRINHQWVIRQIGWTSIAECKPRLSSALTGNEWASIITLHTSQSVIVNELHLFLRFFGMCNCRYKDLIPHPSLSIPFNLRRYNSSSGKPTRL